MARSAFADRDRPPSLDEMETVVGEKVHLWHTLVDFMRETYELEGELKFYGKSFGWMLWFRRGGKNLLALYPQKEGLCAQVTLGPTLIDSALSLPLGPVFRRAIEEARPYPEGRWLFVSLQDEDEIEDVKRLVILKKRPPRVRGTRRDHG